MDMQPIKTEKDYEAALPTHFFQEDLMETWHEIHVTLPEYFSGKTVDVILQPVDTNHYQVSQTATTGINAIFGKWPGEETDAEIDELLEQLS